MARVKITLAYRGFAEAVTHGHDSEITLHDTGG